MSQSSMRISQDFVSLSAVDELQRSDPNIDLRCLSSDQLCLASQVPARERYFQRKYVLDRLAGVVLFVVTSPLTLFLVLLIRLTSSGGGLYRQTRVGLHGETFEIIKLRSMVQNAEKPGQAQWCVKGDSRITRLGRVLRKLHLDELPQLWNVAKGEMSLVGPRPERPEICRRLARNVIPCYYRRNTVKPGITGLAQINLPPDETDDDVRRKQILDLCYIDTANGWLDMRMIVATALRMFGIKGDTVTRLMRLSRIELVEHVATKSVGDSAVIDSEHSFCRGPVRTHQCKAKHRVTN
ncbi:UDP-N-acetylgalactosamine-undecaprenyl-phosphate N-acetylgalactosaminephosphotransferase [Planctomycetes bacterium CA13]|uniref:UDP-N-acetylgalactosamine-undecaprenyl-phosphate N-acetylgalactosaminephosphotransferase n=1 Tax=Novipirellula herctigrandis TaxID=2527986 RepID=A0A5C5Z1H5_9BACT|nr:UDP-N-acetylgalactosamine-undecaprenyl-phosphate N-acetylgalactosaminephosphotransferase [Planctomycetes bacterium CA13]